MESEAYQRIGGVWQLCRPEARLAGAWSTQHEVYRYSLASGWDFLYAVQPVSPGGTGSNSWEDMYHTSQDFVFGQPNQFDVVAVFQFDPRNAGLPYTAEWFESETGNAGTWVSLGVQNGVLDESSSMLEGTATGFREIPWLEQRYYRVYVSVAGAPGNYSPTHAVTDQMQLGEP